MSSKQSPFLRTGLFWLPLFVCLGLAMVIGQLSTGVLAQGDRQQKPPLFKKPQGKLSTILETLARPQISTQSIDEQLQQVHLPAGGPGSLLWNPAGELLVYIRVASVSEATQQALSKVGATIIHVAEEYLVITAYISPARLKQAAALEVVKSIQQVHAPRTSGRFEPAAKTSPPVARPAALSCPGGATISEAVDQLRVAEARSRFNVNGDGAFVGILSDSFDTATDAPTRLSDDIASGDLPGTGNPCNFTKPVRIIDEYNLPPGGSAGIDEGRAMAQLVHDVAPGAKILFATAVEGGQFGFADNIRLLQESGAKILVDDILYADEPFFQDGPVSVAIKDVTDAGALYFTAAGNFTDRDTTNNVISSYETTSYRPTDCPAVTFDSQPFNIGIDCHNFNPTGADALLKLTLDGGGYLQLSFQWAEPWERVVTDFDIFFVDESGAILSSGLDRNKKATQRPWEFLSYHNDETTPQQINVVIARYSGNATPPLRFIVFNQSRLRAMEYNASNSTDIFGPTIFGHAGSKEALSIAAVPFDDPDTPSHFTSHGLLTYYYEAVQGLTPAAPLNPPEVRYKPDVAATSGACTTFFHHSLFDSDANCYRFPGTSAAAPHAAAVAALLWEWTKDNGGSLNQAATEQILEDTAAPIANGTPEISGAGLVDAMAALSPELSANLAVSPFPILIDTQRVSYTLTISNYKLFPLANAEVNITIPPQTTYVPGSAGNGGSEADGVISWSVPSIPGLSNEPVSAGTLQRIFAVSVTEAIASGDSLNSMVSILVANDMSFEQTFSQFVNAKVFYLPVVFKG